MAVLVVGGAGGIGSATVARLKAAGREVVVLDRAHDVEAADPQAVATFLQQAPPVDALVHLAGTVGTGGIEDHSVAEWRRVLDDNLTTAFVVCQAVIPQLQEQRRGAIVLMSSVNGRTGGNRLSGPAYAAAKAAIIGLTRHLARDLAPVGVRVNALAPGPVETPMLARLSELELRALRETIPLRRVAAPEEIAEAIAFLLSDQAASITGAVIDINGGMWMG
ncbi:MAG: SDR family oxidoreductase [Chloroflexi bacterium]|jgi:NAD(P)-dependent dehydrogenase (short-subunit alcohol dehydrogenase family)|nr:SDR family oxidoreductase [Chloroflexota bacterium]